MEEWILTQKSGVQADNEIKKVQEYFAVNF